MERDPPELASIAQAIRAYLARHPHARDTADGVRQWWLADLGRPCGPEPVQRALDHLVAEGVVEGRALGDGRVVYGAGCGGAGERGP